VAKFLKRTTQILAAIASIVVLLLLTVVVLSQTPFVRGIVMNEIRSAIESSTNGRLVSGDLEGNLLSGFLIKNVHIKLHSGTAYDTVDILRADEVLARYSVIRYLRQNEFGVTSLVLVNPVIKLLKFSGDTTWNYQLLFKAPKKNAPPSKFTMAIDLQSIRISNGTFICKDYNRVDSVAIHPVAGKLRPIEWTNLEADNLGLDARIFARGLEAQSLRIDDLHLKERMSGVDIQHLELSAYHDSLQTRIDLGQIVTTKSTLRFAAELDPASILAGHPLASLKDAEARVQLNGPVINTAELTQFIPALKFLGGSPGINLLASGTFGNLHVQRLALDLRGKGALNVTGTIKNLHDPKEIFMDFDLTGKEIQDASFRTYVPGLTIPDITHVGVVTVRSLHYEGTPKNFKVAFDAQSPHGNFTGKGTMDLRTKTPRYIAEVTSEHADIGSLLGRPELASDLNIQLSLNGIGTNPKTLSSTVVLKTTKPSTFEKYSVTALDGTAQVANGLATSDHLEFSLAGGPSVSVRHATFDFGNPTHAYVVQGGVTNLPLKRYVPAFNSSQAQLAADLDIKGEGTDIESVSGTVNATLSNLVADGQQFQDVVASIAIAPRSIPDTGRAITLTSDVADISLTGKYEIIPLLQAITSRVATFDTAFARSYFLSDAGSGEPELHSIIPVSSISDSAVSLSKSANSNKGKKPEKGKEIKPPSTKAIDALLDVNLKDLRPLAALMPNVMLLAHGNVQLAATGTADAEMNFVVHGDLTDFLMRPRLLGEHSGDSTVAIASVADTNTHAPVASSTTSDSTHSTVDSTHLKDSSAISISSTPAANSPVASTSTPDTTVASAASTNASLANTATTPHSFIPPRIQLTPTKFDLELDHVGTDARALPSKLSGSLRFDADSTVRFGGLLLFGPHAKTTFAEREIHYSAVTTFSQRYRVHVVGTSRFQNTSTTISGRDHIGLDNQMLSSQTLPGGNLLSAVDTLSLVVNKNYKWSTIQPFNLAIGTNGRISLDTINLVHLESGDLRGTFTEHFMMGGTIFADTISAWMNVPNFRLNELPHFVSLSGPLQRFGDIDGKVERLDVRMDGTLEDPSINALVHIDRLRYGGMSFDSSNAVLSYDRETLRGSLSMHVDSLQLAINNTGEAPVLDGLSSKNKLDITIDSIPMLLAFKHGPNYGQDSAAVKNRTLSARVETNHFPIDIAEAFLPAVDQLSGFGDISLTLAGTEEHIKFGGTGRITEGAFLITATNVYYGFNAALSFADEVLHIDTLSLRNTPDDDPSGEAEITGLLKFHGFNIENIDVKAKTRRLTVMTAASKSTMKSIYGPLAISSTYDPLEFVGPLSGPLLKGSVTIVQSFLTIPPSQTAANANSSDGITYKTYAEGNILIDSTELSKEDAKQLLAKKMAEDSLELNDKLFPAYARNIYSDESDTSVNSSTASRRLNELAGVATGGDNFMDRMQYDLSVSLSSDAWVIVPIDQLNGFLGEQLRGELRTQEPLKVQRGDDKKYHVTGSLQLTENSSYMFYKTFSPTTGTITFHDNPTNPELDLIAEYTGPHNTANQSQARNPGTTSTTTGTTAETKIRLIVTGYMSAPHIGIEIYERSGPNAEFVKREGNTDDTKEDALYFLFSGSYKNELDQSQQIGAIQNAGYALPSQMATSLLNNIFGATIFKNLIRSMNLEYGGSLAASRLKLTAGYRDLVFHYGTSGIANAQNSDYSIEVPLSFFMNFNGARSLVFDFDYHPLQTTQSYEALQQPNYLAKFLWRIPLP
jgi:hypothetical protein